VIFPSSNKFINPISIDIHSHLLPGIDDGTKSIEESLTIIKKFQQLGYTKLITTPHIMSHIYQNTKDIILEKLDLLQTRIQDENINITIEASAEYYLDNDFLDKIKKKDILPFTDKYVLFETTYQSRPMILNKAIFEMQSKGYTPVLAHPERYLYLHNNGMTPIT
jgi:tyrosine-protein phosphatase YwqE